MTDGAPTDPVLVRFRRELEVVYGDGVDRVVLFGSRARGDWRADSDYDIAVFLKHPAGLWDELGKLARITTDILDDTGASISAKPFAASLWRERSPLMLEIRTDGIEF
jgi:predicted nucleotidyltransferase